MKNIRKLLSLIASFTLICALLSSCGGVDKSSNYAANGFAQSAAPEAAYDEFLDYDYGWDSVEEMPAEAEEPIAPNPNTNTVGNPGKSSSEASSEDSGDKIIKNGFLSVETLGFDKFIRDLEASVATYGGYVENSSCQGSVNYRSANYTVRIPSQKYDSFISEVGTLGTVTSSNESIENVTLQYVDIEARLSALKSERDSFMALMDKAETIDEILQIQSYLTDVNYQIESYTSQLKTLANKVSYSTVQLDIYEVARITPEAPKTVGERIKTGFSESVYNVVEGLKSFFVTVIVSLPYLAVYAIVIAIIVTAIVLILRASRKRQEKKIEAYRRAKEQAQNDGENAGK